VIDRTGNIYAELDRLEVEQVVNDEIAIPADASPLDFLKAVYLNAAVPLSTRLRAGVAAAQYCHPKLSVVASPDSPAFFAERLEAQLRKATLIEHQTQAFRRRV
jgi:hypothetical protein